MKLAIASDDNKTVTGHIGRVRGFIILEVENGEIKSREYRQNVFTHHSQGQHDHNHEHGHHHGEGHGHGHESLADGLKDCANLICTGAGWRVVEDLKKFGVNVVFTHEDDADAAAIKYEKGELEINEEGTCHAH